MRKSARDAPPERKMSHRLASRLLQALMTLLATTAWAEYEVLQIAVLMATGHEDGHEVGSRGFHFPPPEFDISNVTDMSDRVGKLRAVQAQAGHCH
jgi:hypothetical protein